MAYDGASHSKHSRVRRNARADSDLDHEDLPHGLPGFANAVYYPNWRAHSHPPSSLMLGFVSHVIYAFAWYIPRLLDHRYGFVLAGFLTNRLFVGFT